MPPLRLNATILLVYCSASLLPADSLPLFQQSGSITRKPTHCFEPVTRDVARKRSAAYYVSGDLSLDYDQDTCRLSVQALADKTSFDAVFDFGLARAPEAVEYDAVSDSAVSPASGTGEGQLKAASSPCGDGPGCYASSDKYECCKTCPAGYDCSCRVVTTGCSCTDCKKLEAVGVLIPGE
jgi:hypothetical protein